MTLFGHFWTPFLTPFGPFGPYGHYGSPPGDHYGPLGSIYGSNRPLLPLLAIGAQGPQKGGPKKGSFWALPGLAHMGPSGPGLARDPSSGRTN